VRYATSCDGDGKEDDADDDEGLATMSLTNKQRRNRGGS